MTIGIFSYKVLCCYCYSNIPPFKSNTKHAFTDLWKIEIVYFLLLSFTFEDWDAQPSAPIYGIFMS